MNTKLFLPILLILALVFSGCITRPGDNGIPNPPGQNGNGGNGTTSMWMAYSPVQADTNPWQINTSIPDSDEHGQVRAWLTKLGVKFDDATFIPREGVTCQALNCPRGDYLIVHTTDVPSQDILVDIGFSAYEKPFVFVHMNATDNYLVTLVNAGDESIYYGGCNEFIPEKIMDGETTPQPPKVCVWEGLPATLAAGKSTTFDWSPLGNGTYRVSVGYGLGCDATKPLSQADCAQLEAVSSVEFSVGGVGPGAFVTLSYDEKQCRSNPWEQGTDSTGDVESFTAWVRAQGLHPTNVHTNDAPSDFIACAACSCPTGRTFEIVVPASERAAAEGLGFTYEGSFTDTSVPNFAAASWYVYTPYQCFANLWNTTNDPVHSVEKDIRKLVEYLEDKGVHVTYTAFVRGVSLSQQCTKQSTDKYGVGVLDEESKQILASLAFVPAGKTHNELFTSTTDQAPVQLLFRTKFCAPFPWGTPDLTIGNEQAVSERVQQWLNEQGIPSLKTPTIHELPPSASGTCDTDSGKGVLVTVPEWTVPHLGAQGFLKPNTLFDAHKTQLYPGVSEGEHMNAPPLVELAPGTTAGTYDVTITNPSTNVHTLYFDGCNPFVSERFTNGVYVIKGARVCAEAPEAFSLEAGRSKTLPWIPEEDAIFRMRVSYGYDCLPNASLEGSFCTETGITYSPELAVDANVSA